jgi:protein-S-isoprenylcysteine O-methyltransferase Ste14
MTQQYSTSTVLGGIFATPPPVALSPILEIRWTMPQILRYSICVDVCVCACVSVWVRVYVCVDTHECC